MGDVTQSVPFAARAARLLGVFVALVLVWRVLAAGFDTLAERGNTTSRDVSARVETPIPDAVSRERLARNPTGAAALLVLALQLERSGKNDDAREAIRHALRLAPADRQVLTEAANFATRAGRDQQAFAIWRRLVDLHPSARDDVWPILTAALDTTRGRDLFDQLARDNPQWWPEFFRFVCEQGRNARALQMVFAMRVDAATVTDEERRCAIQRLQREGQWSAAYQLWLKSLPAEQRQQVGFPFNGGFEWPLSNLGFDWLVSAEEGVAVSTQQMQGATGRRALQLTFSNQSFTGSFVYQYLMLGPGSYLFEGRGRVDSLPRPLAVQWVLFCAGVSGGEARVLARGDRFVGSADWMEFRHNFAVAKDCPVQVLRLELADPKRRAASQGATVAPIRGNVWFDDLRVRVRSN